MKKKYYLFGAGNNCFGAIKFFGKKNIINIIDNNIEKVGNKVEGILVIGFEDFLKIKNDKFVIITAFTHSEQIKKQLIENGIMNYYMCPAMQYGFDTCEEIIHNLELEKQDKIAIYGENPLADLLVEKMLEIGMKDKIQYFVRDTYQHNNINSYNNYRMIDVEELDQAVTLLLAVENTEDDIRNRIYGKINNCIIDIFAPEHSVRHYELIENHNKHIGKRCFLVGNGSSLEMNDLEMLAQKEEICFGCNGIFRAFNKTDWRPTYFVVGDYSTFNNIYNEIVLFDSSDVFVREFFNTTNEFQVRKVSRYRACLQNYYPDYPNFSEDISERVYAAPTIMYDMLQIAAYMGFREIYLLGVDFNWNIEDKNKLLPAHFCENYYAEQASIAGKEYRGECLHAYMAAEKHSREHGFRIYNATRGGELEVFERVDFDSLF